MENCVLEQRFAVAVLRNEIRKRMTATISLFIYVSQQDVTHKEMVFWSHSILKKSHCLLNDIFSYLKKL